MKIKHILFPVDFSGRCASAVPFVDDMARRFEARLTLLTVLHPQYGGGVAGAPVFDETALRAQTQIHLERAFAAEFTGIPVSRVVESGDPGHVIASYAHGHEVDLIMMPTHGYGPFRQLLIGSVAAKVLHDAHCPVWTDAHTDEAPDQVHRQLKTIVCAVDTNSDQRQATVSMMKQAAGLAQQLGAGLHVVHAVPGMEAWPERQMDQEFEAQLREIGRKTITDLEREAGINAPVCVNSGTVPDVIEEELKRQAADLLVIGRGAIHGALGRLRTHAHAIIKNSPCPVISI